MKVYFLSTLVHFILSYHIISCDENNRRIINGDIANIGHYPYYVLLDVVKVTAEGPKSFRCGGGTINSYFVITAAHCLYRRSYANIAFPISALDDPLRMMKIEQNNMIVHESYNPSNYDNDIALLKLPVAIKESDEIKFLSLPDPNFNYDGVTGVEIVGMGYHTMDLNVLSSELRIFYPKIVSLESCRLIWNVKVNNICAIEQSVNDRQGVCMGDSGSPLVLPTPSKSYVLIGIASYGSSDCNPSIYQVFTKVGAYNQWIGGHIRALTGLNPVNR